MNTLATASAWTSNLAGVGSQIIEDIGVAIIAGLSIFAVVFGLNIALKAMIMASTTEEYSEDGFDQCEDYI
jgi:hypothetical protein